MKRRLAAILSADAVAYSRLMAEDEEGTAQVLSGARRLIGDQVAQHGGRVVDAPGDNLLAEFPSVVDAVRCAVEIQAELARRNTDVPSERRLLFRIGVNLGDVLVEGERIVGDGVNVAARLEALAEPGGICVSGTAFDQVEGKIALPFVDAGAQQIKNIQRPVRVYRIQLDPTSISSRPKWSWRVPALAAAMLLLLAASGLWLWTSREPPVRTQFSELEPAVEAPRGPAIAVLHFDNLSGDPQQDYFSHGLTEDIATALSRFPGLRVVSPRAVSAPGDAEGELGSLAAALGVRYVIRGSVRRSPETVRVAARLLDAPSGAQLWS